MPIEPTVVELAEQPYVAIRGLVTMETFALVTDRMPEVFSWLGAHGIEPAGSPFLKFNVIDMERELEIEAGVPVAASAAADGDVVSGVLPAGRYVSATHVGDVDELVAVTAGVLDWAAERALEWDVSETPAGRRWGCRLLVNKTHDKPENAPDRQETEILLRLAD
jgi:effector-binding domain-containing protein